jgi:hypothetical protein
MRRSDAPVHLAEARVLCFETTCSGPRCPSSVPVARLPFQLSGSDTQTNLLVVLYLTECSTSQKPGACVAEIQRLTPLLHAVGKAICVCSSHRR